MMSTGNRRCCAWSASMSWTPSIGPMRRSMSARSNRCTVAASSARRGSPTGVTSKPIAPRRIVSTSRIAASSSTTRTFRVTVAGSAGPARSVGGLRRGAPRLRSPCRRSLHRRSVGPARSVGGLGPGGTPPPSPGRRSLQRGSAGPARPVGCRGTDRPSSAGFARATDRGGGSEGAVEAPFDDLGGLRRGATRLRSPCRRSLHRRSAGPARSVGGRGTDRPSSAGFARATDPGGGSEGAVEAPFGDLGGLRRRSSLLLSPALDAEVELLQPLQVRLALGEVLAEPRDLPLERENRRHRVPAHPDPRVRAVSREVRVVGGHGPRVVALLDEAVGVPELRPIPPRPRRPGGAATRAKGGEQSDDRYPHARGRSTVKRLPFPSRDSAVTRPPWAYPMPPTTDRPRPVPPPYAWALPSASKSRGAPTA